MPKTWYTQRQWDRVVGWGKVPKEYNKPKSDEEKMSEYDEYEPRRPHQSARRRARIAAWVARSNDIASESEEDE